MNAYAALNIELRHLCQRQNAGDRWRNSIFKQVVRAMSVPRNDLFFAICCAGLHPFFSSTSSCLWEIRNGGFMVCKPFHLYCRRKFRSETSDNMES